MYMNMKPSVWFFAGIAAPENAGYTQSQQPQKRPNTVIILADDMCYSDMNLFGSEIAAPMNLRQQTFLTRTNYQKI